MTVKTNTTEAIRAAWDARAEAYAESIADPSSRGVAVRIELAAFERALPAGQTLDLLDAGCGVGFHGRITRGADAALRPH
jgi:sarcosine oxidase gamma subunit